MDITLWGRTNSSNVMKALWLLDELGLSFERIDAGLRFGRNDTDEYRAMNPFGLIPVLQDGPVTLFESNAILRYLCNARAPESPLYPRDPARRGAVEAWMDAQLAGFAAMGIVFQQLVRTPPGARNEAALASALAASTEKFAVLDGQLAKRSWIAGDAMSLADISFGPLVHRWFALDMARPELPALRGYYERLSRRPAYVARCAIKLS